MPSSASVRPMRARPASISGEWKGPPTASHSQVMVGADPGPFAGRSPRSRRARRGGGAPDTTSRVRVLCSVTYTC